MHAQFNYFEIEMTRKQAESVSHSGDCENDVNVLLRDKKIIRQIKKIPDDKLKRELKEYGAWSKEELNDRKANEQRIIWIAGCNIREDINERFRRYHKKEYYNTPIG